MKRTAILLPVFLTVAITFAAACEVTVVVVPTDATVDDATIHGDDAGPDGAMPVDGAAPDSAVLADAGCAASAAGVARGTLQVVYTDPAFGTPAAALETVGVVGDTLLLSSGRNPGAAQPWKGGWLKSCTAGNCAATLAMQLTGNLHFPAQFFPSAAGTYVQGGTAAMVDNFADPSWGDLLFFPDVCGSTPSNKGAYFDVLGATTSSYGPTALFRVADTFGVTYKGVSNTGDNRKSSILKDGNPATILGTHSGGSVNGELVFATATRTFSYNKFINAASYPVNSLALWDGANLANYLADTDAAISAPFAFGERVGAFAQSKTTGALSVLYCDAEATCATHAKYTIVGLPAWTNNLVGATATEVIWWVDNGATATFYSISKASLQAAAPVVSTLALNVQKPTSPVVNNGQWLFFVSSGTVVRIAL